MDRRIVILAAMVIVISAAVFLAFPGENGDYSRILILKMHLADGIISDNSAEVRYGHAPDSTGRIGPLQGRLLTEEGSVAREFSVWDPSRQLGDAVETNTNGTENLHSMAVISRENDLVLILPFTGDEARFTLTDRRTGRSLTSLDLTKAKEKFEQTYPADPAISKKNEPVFFFQDGPVGMLALGAILFVLLLIVFFFMVREQ